MSTRADPSAAIRAGLRGVTPLDGRLEPWMQTLCADGGAAVTRTIEEHGSPVNLLEPSAVGRNARELADAARDAGVVDVRVFLARKANKGLVFVDEAQRLDLGVDVASERELRQTLDRGVAPERIVVTAAVKPRGLLELCVTSGVTIVVDNDDELALLAAVAGTDGPPVPVAIRLASDLGPGRLPTRFGLTEQDALALVDVYVPTVTSGIARPGAGGPAPGSVFTDARTSAPAGHRLRIVGVHFHLDGYAADDRITALRQAIDFVDALFARGHGVGFVDIGGGIPMRYLDDEAQWDAFWTAHREGLTTGRPLTYDGHGLGLTVHDGAVVGRPKVYPAAQPLIRGDWLRQILAAPASADGSTSTIADALRARRLQLRCEPGRSLLDGCGMTAASVVQRKRRRDGTWLIGLAMNRTQCRSTADDLLVDPLLLPTGAGESTGTIEGYLVGAYCIERELLTWRRMRFPDGVRVGDTVVFPNTAGYHMHILESASHQIPLARNVVVDAAAGQVTLDAIDA